MHEEGVIFVIKHAWEYIVLGITGFISLIIWIIRGLVKRQDNTENKQDLLKADIEHQRQELMLIKQDSNHVRELITNNQSVLVSQITELKDALKALHRRLDETKY